MNMQSGITGDDAEGIDEFLLAVVVILGLDDLHERINDDMIDPEGYDVAAKVFDSSRRGSPMLVVHP